MRLRGRAAIAGLYDLLFRSVFRLSRLKTEVSDWRALGGDAAMVHVRVYLEVPSGAMPGDHRAVSSLLVQREGAMWSIASLHNTLVMDGGRAGLPIATPLQINGPFDQYWSNGPLNY